MPQSGVNHPLAYQEGDDDQQNKALTETAIGDVGLQGAGNNRRNVDSEYYLIYFALSGAPCCSASL
jgi:hypothetical protein